MAQLRVVLRFYAGNRGLQLRHAGEREGENIEQGRGSESIRVVFALSDMPEFIPVLSSNDKGVALMERIISELGTDDPEQWMPVFMQRAIAENTHNLKKKLGFEQGRGNSPTERGRLPRPCSKPTNRMDSPSPNV